MTIHANGHRLLPHHANRIYLTDGGLETTMIFHENFELPCFAAFPLLETEDGRAALKRYYRRYGGIAREQGTGFILEGPTWRASADWGAELGYDAAALDRINRDSVAFLKDLRTEIETGATPVLVSGCIGPRGDGYTIARAMSGAEAHAFHTAQVTAFAEAGADLVTAITMTYSGEAIGVARAADDAGIACVISFTTETDGLLPSGQSLGEAIEEVDASTNRAPAYYMINCAHPTHFAHVLTESAPWRERISGVRANASTMSHEELDEAVELDDGNPAELGAQYAELQGLLPAFRVMGGCCGTDHRHIEAMSSCCVQAKAA